MSVITGKATPRAGAIVGIVAVPHNLTGQVANKAQLIGELAMAYSTAGVKYEGDYEVIPTVDGLNMATRGKLMVDDVIVRAIPFYEVSNLSGGNTIYIADKIEME